MNAAKVCSLVAQGQNVPRDCGNRPGKAELWKNVGRNVSVDQVLENFSAGCERNRTIGIRRGGVTITLDFQVLKKESRR